MVGGYFLTSRPDVADFLPATFKRTLEIGCGADDFSAAHLAQADERWGIEPDAGAAEMARTQLDRLVGISLSAWADTQYPQFGFRVREAD